ncbi:fungal-specific transcription factor domain-domain-containing protein [Lobosporangium transversale]|uniref:Fungal-specific transcription factor domain-domain-containing protein n=1 Tax=Lobosporangium transversale TaxID=64571 RepID=A0A1Y2H4R7_9FUNG|nr:fungal-specific transcription factor domain-domain-containing protein [Lobosporangium transversale]ORZ28713.1 fungal-specific transcription factor domain-domain-containing protein [Lobosporangium transversale]|eukprot:XP_021886386.1 fungal-specific transcription factor domain-domain-containing protein [Lobosporangium transversale]
MFNSPILLDFNNAKRSKITKACDNCRRRRVKCDGVPGGCGGCKAAKTQCVYTTSNTKRGPPKGYVEVIEDRLGKIENMLTSIVKKKALVPSSSSNKGTPTQSDVEDNNDDDDNNNDNDHASIYSSDLVEVKKQPPASPPLRPARSITPASSSTRAGSVAISASSILRHSPLVSRNRSLSSLLPFPNDNNSMLEYPDSVSQVDMATLTKSFDKLGSTSIRTSVPFPWLSPEQSHQYGRNFLHFTPQSLEPPLPVLFSRPSTPSISSDQQLRLLNAYFDHFNVFLPIIHRHQFMKQWQRQFCPLCSPSIHSRSQSPTRTKQLKQQQQQPSPQEVEAHKEHLLNPVIPLSPLLLNALLAVASKVPIVNHSEGSPTASMHSQEFFDAARLLLDDFLDVPRVSTVQALTLMSQFHHQNQWKITRSNSYLATAIRMAHELGLNRDPEMLCGAEADALRCLWWSLFILDHQFSAWLGLSLLIQGKESNVELPMDFSSSPVELRGFVCMVRLVKILSSVLQHSYSTQSLPPQFGGHDSMVSYIEGSLTSWLSNLAPDLRWHYPNGVGARKSPLNPQQQQAIVVGVKHATALAKDYSEIYPAYLYIMYNMTLILLHRPYIVGAAGSPAAAQSNTICTGSGRAITDIAQGLDIMHCSYVVNRYALYALLQAGVIHAMNAVYDRRGSNVAMDYYKRTLHILGNFLTCTEYAGGVAEGIKVLHKTCRTPNSVVLKCIVFGIF